MAPKIKPAHKQQLSKAFIEGVHLSLLYIRVEEEMLLHSLTTHVAQKEIPTEITNLLQEFCRCFSKTTTITTFSTMP